MDREILFRAKIDPDAYSYDKKSEWVYGYYTKYSCIFSGRSVIEQENDDYAVLDKTVCQYTGLTDMNDTKIFEGDILQVNYHGDEIGRVYIYYKYAMHLCDAICGDIDYDTLGMLNANYQLEVIGNVYDNPEMVSQDTH